MVGGNIAVFVLYEQRPYIIEYVYALGRSALALLVQIQFIGIAHAGGELGQAAGEHTP